MQRPESHLDSTQQTPSDAHSHLSQLHTGTTLAQVRESGKTAHTAALPSLRITGADGEEQASRNASAASKQSETALERASQAFGQARTPEEQSRALDQLRSIVRDTDKTAQDLQRTMDRESDALVPGMSRAGRDVLRAGDKLKDEVNKLNDDQADKVIPLVNQWSAGSPAERAKIESDLRAQNMSGVADAMTALGRVQHDHSGQFRNGERVEEQMTRHFGPGKQDSLKARTDARAMLASALRMAHKDDEAQRVEDELHHLH